MLLALGRGLVLLNIIGLALQDRENTAGLLTILLLEGALYLAAVYCLTRPVEGSRLLPFILLVAVLLRIGPLLYPPFLSTDIYRYVWDGRVQGAGINPYRYVPSDDALAGLRDTAIYPNINRVGYAAARNKPVLCFAHVTNQMGKIEGDFEKGVADGAEESLRLISVVAVRWISHHRQAAPSSSLQTG